MTLLYEPRARILEAAETATPVAGLPRDLSRFLDESIEREWVIIRSTEDYTGVDRRVVLTPMGEVVLSQHRERQREIGAEAIRTFEPGLVGAVDELLAFVFDERFEGSCIPREEFARFRDLDRQVMLLAREAGLRDLLPDREVLARHLDQADWIPDEDGDRPIRGMGKVKFEGTTHLPGDWVGREFQAAPDHWRESLLTLRTVAGRKSQTPQVNPTVQSDDLPPVDLHFDTEEELPAEFLEGGEVGGNPLGRDYLETSPKWSLKSPYLSRAMKAGKLTRHARVGVKVYHSYTELLRLRDHKTDGVD